MNNDTYLFAYRVKSKSAGLVFQGVMYSGVVSPIPGSIIEYGFLAREVICVHNKEVRNFPLEDCIRIVQGTDIWEKYHKLPLV